MSHGKPVVSTRIKGSGVSWVNAHNESGLTVTIQDDKAIADAIREILSDADTFNRLSKGAYQRYSTYFTQEKMIKKCEEVYKNVLN